LVSTAFYLGKEKLRHSLGRPSRSDFVQLVLEQMKEATEEIQFLKQLQETITATLSSN
jgi:hypothetical protein